MDKVSLSVSFLRSARRDELALFTPSSPITHFLESWGDAEPVDSYLSLVQPIIAPLFDTRAAPMSLLKWVGGDADHYAYLRDYWKSHVFPRQSSFRDFDAFWDSSLQRGIVVLTQAKPQVLAATTAEPAANAPPNAPLAGGAVPTGTPNAAPQAPSTDPVFQADWRGAARSIVDENKQVRAARRDDRYELHLYESVALRDGRHANNPWLQELPDPITKVTWGNVASMSPALAQKLGVSEGDVVSLKTTTKSIEVPVFVQPGQEGRSISVSLGYGRKLVGKAGKDVGVNAYPLDGDGAIAPQLLLRQHHRRQDRTGARTSRGRSRISPWRGVPSSSRCRWRSSRPLRREPKAPRKSFLRSGHDALPASTPGGWRSISTPAPAALPA